MLNAGKQWNLVKPAIHKLEFPFEYFMSPSTTRASWKLVAGESSNSSAPPRDADAFWNDKLAEGKSNFENFVFGSQLLSDLARLSSYCEETNIRFRFVVLPTHDDYFALIEKAKLTTEYEHFLSRLAEIAITYNWDVRSARTGNKQNFRDPVHFMSEVGSELLRELLKPHPPTAH